MRQINYTRALWEALHDALESDERVFLVGEDIGVQGNIFGVTFGFIEEFGRKRIRNSPISEAAIIPLPTVSPIRAGVSAKGVSA